MIKTELETDFEIATSFGGQLGLGLVSERYGPRVLNPEAAYQFHDTDHSQRVARRARVLLEAIRKETNGYVNRRMIALADFIAKRHDTMIDFEERTETVGSFEKVLMKRDIGNNERRSAQEAIIFMDWYNYHLKKPVFNSDHKEVTREGIMVTVPGYDPGLKTVIQPNLTRFTGVVARSVALADLASATASPVRFLYDGDSLFREEQLDIFRALSSDVPLNDGQKEFYRSRGLEWTNSQVSFAEGRVARLNEDLNGLPENTKRAVLAVLNKGPETIEAVRLNTKRRTQMSFEELMIDFGYLVDTRVQHINRSHLLAA